MSTATLDFNRPAHFHHLKGNKKVLKLHCVTKSLKNRMKDFLTVQVISLYVSDAELQASSWNNQAHPQHCGAEQCCTSQKMFLGEVLSDCFWCPLSLWWWEQAGSSGALGVQGSSLALAFHTRSAVKACDCPQTLPPTAPLHPHSHVVWPITVIQLVWK